MTASPDTASTRLPAPPAPATRRWLALGILALAQFLVVLDASIVNIALPVLGAQFGMDTVALAWVITAYVLAFGGLLLLGGRLGDRWGHRRVFLLGTAGFVASSALAGFSVAEGMLLTARALQGASAALLAPAALALLMRLFADPADRSMVTLFFRRSAAEDIGVSEGARRRHTEPDPDCRGYGRSA